MILIILTFACGPSFYIFNLHFRNVGLFSLAQYDFCHFFCKCCTVCFLLMIHLSSILLVNAAIEKGMINYNISLLWELHVHVCMKTITEYSIFAHYSFFVCEICFFVFVFALLSPTASVWELCGCHVFCFVIFHDVLDTKK